VGENKIHGNLSRVVHESNLATGVVVNFAHAVLVVPNGKLETKIVTHGNKLMKLDVIAHRPGK
jgi:hypothetical protein